MIAANIEVEFDADTRDLEAGTRRAQGVVDNFLKRGASVRSNPFSSWTSGLRAVGSQARSTDGILKNMLSTAGGFIAANVFQTMVGGARQLASSLIGANANAETLQNTLNIAAGSIEEGTALFAQLQTMAARTPFEFPELVQGATALESLGNEAMDFLPTLGNVAAGTNKTIDQVVQAFLDAQVGEFERLKEFGIRVNQEGEEAIFSWVENGQQMQKAVEKGNTELYQSTLTAIWNDRYAGAMDTLSGTFNGMWSTMTDNVNLTMQRLSKPIFEWSKEALGYAIGFFDEFNSRLDEGESVAEAALGTIRVHFSRAFGRSTMQTFLTFVRNIRRGFLDVRRAAEDGLRTIRPLFESSIGFIVQNRAQIETALRGILRGFLAFKALTTVLGALRAIPLLLGAILSPMGLLMAAIAGFGIAYETNFLGFADLVNSLIGTVQRFGGVFISTFQTLTGAGLDPLSAGLIAFVGTARGLLGPDNPITRFAELVNQGFQRFKSDVFPTLQALSGYFLQVITDGDYLADDLASIPERLQPFVRWLGVLLSAGQKVVEGFGENGLRGAFDAFIGFLPTIVSEAGVYLQSLSGLFIEAAGWMIDRGRELFDGFLRGAIEFHDNTLIPWLNEVSPRIFELFNLAGDLLVARGQEVMDGFRHGAQDYWNNVAIPFFQGIPNWIIGLFANAGEWLKDAGGNVVGGLKAGIEERMPELSNPFDGLGTTLSNTVNRETEARSPARKLIPSGHYIVDGVIRGVEERAPELMRTLSGMAKGVPDTLRSVLAQYNQGYSSERFQELSRAFSGVSPETAFKLSRNDETIWNAWASGNQQFFDRMYQQFGDEAGGIMEHFFMVLSQGEYGSDILGQFSGRLQEAMVTVGKEMAHGTFRGFEAYERIYGPRIVDKLRSAFNATQALLGGDISLLEGVTREQSNTSAFTGGVTWRGSGLNEDFGIDDVAARRIQRMFERGINAERANQRITDMFGGRSPWLNAVMANSQYAQSGQWDFGEAGPRGYDLAAAQADLRRAQQSYSRQRTQAPVQVQINASGIKDPETVATLVAQRVMGAISRAQTGMGMA